jgi:hypothetical protein
MAFLGETDRFLYFDKIDFYILKCDRTLVFNHKIWQNDEKPQKSKIIDNVLNIYVRTVYQISFKFRSAQIYKICGDIAMGKVRSQVGSTHWVNCQKILFLF